MSFLTRFVGLGRPPPINFRRARGDINTTTRNRRENTEFQCQPGITSGGSAGTIDWLGIWECEGKRDICLANNVNDERIFEEPEYGPPSRKTLLTIMRRKIGRGLQSLYEPEQDLPRELEDLAAKLDR